MAAVEIADGLKNKLAIAGEIIAGRDDTIQRLEQSLSEMRATLQAKDERIAGLSAELVRKAGEQAAGLTELDGLRKHSLLQIEQSRAEALLWKAEFEQVDGENKTSVQQYRSKAATLENALSAARGRLGAVEEALAAEQTRSQALEAALAGAEDGAAAPPAASAKRFRVGKLRGGNGLVRRCKL